MKVLWTAPAVEDLKSIARYIARDNAVVARRFADKLKRRAESAGRFPKRGRMVPEFMQEQVRELIESNYRIVYRVTQTSVEILTIFEGHKQLDNSGSHE